MKRLLLFLFLFSLPFYLFSQKMQIQGSVIDSLSREPLPYATIQVVDINNNNVFAGIASDSLASFNFPSVPIKNGYKMLVSYVGYQPKEIPLSLKPHQKSLNFGFIALTPNVNLINEVQVTGHRKVQDLLDRTVYVVDSTILSKTIGTPDILSSFPEIMVNPITLETKIKGKENSLILINGINTGRSVDIRSINPKDIERIEVITSPPSSVDVDYDGVINIVLKQESSKGFWGNVDATLMANGRYADTYTGAVFGWKKMRLNIAYSNYLRNNSWETSEIRNNPTINETYSTAGYCKNPFELTHNFIFNLDYFASPNDFINFSTNNSLEGVDKNIYYTPTRISNGISTPLAPFSIQNTTDYFIGNYTVFYKRNLAKEGNSISANINLHYMDGGEYCDFSYEGAPTHVNDENGKKKSINMKVEHINQLGKTTKLTVGAQAYYQVFSGTLSGAILGNDFSNQRYNIYADLYLGLKGFDINLGLKAERNAMEFSNSSHSPNTQHALFPTIILSRQINNTNRIKAEYRRTSYYPSAWAFSPYRIDIDSMTAFIGNPKLDPSTRNAYELSHSYRTRPITFNSTLFFYKTNKFVSAITSYDSKSFKTTTYENSTGRIFTGLRLSGTAEFFKFINVEPDIQLYYEEYKRDGVVRENTTYTVDLSISIGLPKGFAIGGFGRYYGKRLSPQGYAEPNYSLDAVYIMKRFQKQNLFLYIALRGLTVSKETDYTFDSNINEIHTFDHDTYGLAFRLSYLFNKGKQQRMEKVNTFFESDKK